MNKKVIIPVLGLMTVLTAGFFGLNSVKADYEDKPLFAQEIANKFGLNESDVQSFIEEKKDERHERMNELHSQNLDNAVANGVITEEQKNALNQKHEEMQAQREEHRSEMDSWFADQGIDRDSLMPYMGHGKRMGHFERRSN